MKNFVITFLVMTFGFSATAGASKTVPQNSMVDAEFSVQYFEPSTAIVPDMIDNGGFEVVMDAQRIQVSKAGYHIQAQVESCQTVDSKNYRIIIKERNGVNYLSLHTRNSSEECSGPLRKQTMNFEFIGDIDYELPLVQITPNS